MSKIMEASGVRFNTTTDEWYYYSLEVLPPAWWSGGAFLVGEPNNHRQCRVSGDVEATYSGYWELDGKHYAADEDLTIAEFKAVSEPEMRIAIAAATWSG